MNFSSPEHAKKTMRQSHAVFESNLSQVDCGMAMLCQLRPSVSAAARKWNEAIDYLVANDPSAPKGLGGEKVQGA